MKARVVERWGDPRVEPRLLPMVEPSTWAKVCAALARATWRDVALVLLFAVAVVAMVLGMAVW